MTNDTGLIRQDREGVGSNPRTPPSTPYHPSFSLVLGRCALCPVNASEEKKTKKMKEDEKEERGRGERERGTEGGEEQRERERERE